jgi:hypothetical protein
MGLVYGLVHAWPSGAQVLLGRNGAREACPQCLQKWGEDALQKSIMFLQRARVAEHLEAFLSGGLVNHRGGQLYILSTREIPDLLKIGYTTRSVEERMKEINGVTGVAIPYGVRAVWLVSAAKEIEKEIHNLLRNYRIRQDREFFRLQFHDAYNLIDEYIRLRDLDQ